MKVVWGWFLVNKVQTSVVPNTWYYYTCHMLICWSLFKFLVLVLLTVSALLRFCFTSSGGFPVGAYSYPFQYTLPDNLPGENCVYLCWWKIGVQRKPKEMATMMQFCWLPYQDSCYWVTRQERAKWIAKNKMRDELLCVFLYMSERFRNMMS